MNPILFTHNDLDGAACAVVAKLFYPNIRTIICSYDNIDNNILKHLTRYPRRTVIMSDVSYKKSNDNITELFKHHNTYIADHHESSLWLKDVFEQTNIEKDGKYCGAILLYELLSYIKEYGETTKFDIRKLHKKHYFEKLYNSDTKLYDFLTYVNNWDLWFWVNNTQKEDWFQNKSLRLNNAYYLFEQKFISKVYEYLIGKRKKLFSYNDKNIISEYCKKQEKDILEYVSSKKLAIYHSEKYGDLRCCLVYMEKPYQSLTSSYIKMEKGYSEQYDMTVLTYDTSGSLRNGNNINLCEIAKELGGGGHSYAAGFDWKENKNKFVII